MKNGAIGMICFTLSSKRHVHLCTSFMDVAQLRMGAANIFTNRHKIRTWTRVKRDEQLMIVLTLTDEGHILDAVRVYAHRCSTDTTKATQAVNDSYHLH